MKNILHSFPSGYFPLLLSETWDNFWKIVCCVRICCGSVSEPYLRLQPSGDFYLHSTPLTGSNNLLKCPLMYSNQCMSLAVSAISDQTITLCLHLPVQILEWWFSLQPEISDGYRNSHWFFIWSAFFFYCKDRNDHFQALYLSELKTGSYL